LTDKLEETRRNFEQDHNEMKQKLAKERQSLDAEIKQFEIKLREKEKLTKGLEEELQVSSQKLQDLKMAD